MKTKKVLVRINTTPETDRVLKIVKKKYGLVKDEEAINKMCEGYNKRFLQQ